MPSIPAAVVFAVLFFMVAVVQFVLIIRRRTYFFIPFFVGLLLECAGYIARIFSHFDNLALGPYIVQTMLILVAPPLFAASIYMTLGRVIVKLNAEELSMVPVRYLTKIFVVGDVISFLLQVAGGGYMAAGTLSAMDVGTKVVIGGLAVQLLFFGFFVIVAAIFHWRVKKNELFVHARSHSYVSTAGSSTVETKLTWESLMWGIYIACFLILVRSIFRVVEFVEGNDGFIMRTEYLLYIFDACLMALAGILLSVLFPGFLLRGDKLERSSIAQSASSGESISQLKEESA
ncbi:Protein RTM1 [Penicillium brevicompactum]|uniref:Protein RTM1 n=1 Tax=Penicillium brevicompactum TaxID=5074 RepID=A0A9W9R5C0_PENBR|nr:Protein RTM1 [Penicillium brevicompactum]